MKTLRKHIVENANSARVARRKLLRDYAGEVRALDSLGLDGATMSLPAGIDLKTRAELMNAFRRALVRLQYQDVIVVAACATGGSRNLAPAARHALDGTF